ncbi:hypothetical protein Q4543_15015 [Salipiger sp. 1_MG-2023]|uniref:hypothetical protein n=1 Tax=Salipiger sp. 1_MG-2023 TaxID=3062665 RepID=UPI0026E3CCD0|nr:hypothetical protein [Salipiger sp. 1_MG-2023]MDO6586822.1 hypothetical protein [Salipiger sp. 1_MG-2023]
MTHGPRHGPIEHEDLARWYACEVMADAALYDITTVASACRLVLDHPQATFSDHQTARRLLASIRDRAA